MKRDNKLLCYLNLCICVFRQQWRIQAFPLGGAEPLGGHRPLMQALFGENVSENERIGSRWGAPAAPPWIPQWSILKIKIPS